MSPGIPFLVNIACTLDQVKPLKDFSSSPLIVSFQGFCRNLMRRDSDSQKDIFTPVCPPSTQANLSTTISNPNVVPLDISQEPYANHAHRVRDLDPYHAHAQRVGDLLTQAQSEASGSFKSLDSLPSSYHYPDSLSSPYHYPLSKSPASTVYASMNPSWTTSRATSIESFKTALSGMTAVSWKTAQMSPNSSLTKYPPEGKLTRESSLLSFKSVIDPPDDV